MSGISIAIIGAALCAALAGCGSAIGVMAAGKAAAGVASEKPELFCKLLDCPSFFFALLSYSLTQKRIHSDLTF